MSVGARAMVCALCVSVVSALQIGVRVSAPPSRAAGMMMAERTPLIAGNWKMNTELGDAVKLAKAVAAASAKAPNVGVAVCVPFPFLTSVKDALKGSKVGLGAQARAARYSAQRPSQSQVCAARDGRASLCGAGLLLRGRGRVHRPRLDRHAEERRLRLRRRRVHPLPPPPCRATRTRSLRAPRTRAGTLSAARSSATPTRT